jgi:D-alanyl-D-alanine carboxypeptidase
MFHIRRRSVAAGVLTHFCRGVRSNPFEIYFVYLAFFTTTLSFAADSGSSLSPAVKANIDALVQSQVSGGKTPGIAVAIAKNGKTIYEKSDGVRDISSKAPMLIMTPQPIGSITKQFTAAAILLLQQEKKLSVDDKLSKYVPSTLMPRK